MEDLAAPACGFTYRTRRFMLSHFLVYQLDVKTMQQQMQRGFNVWISKATIYHWHTEEILATCLPVSPNSWATLGEGTDSPQWSGPKIYPKRLNGNR